MLTLEKKAFDLSIAQENSEGVNSRQMMKVFAMCLLGFMFLTSMYYYLGLFQSPLSDHMEELTSIDVNGGPSSADVAASAGVGGSGVATDVKSPSLEVEGVKQEENDSGVSSGGPTSDAGRGSAPDEGVDGGTDSTGGGNPPVR
mmetsp:Transcript_30806/g.42917  ORF Transcript_30806/g.42917 Transcript_30806/m.42917 type:complete len:144 (+) Transcript_30806:135-566(+)|eukprot:CAMPEP_0185266056 /NCGR_PEP_ID=MMETSP1359-20130426/29801_1 /TAXON_ID=552665 /ORGANISM="Bigelowiella longifila, Strain CCMP242" /LENGTH=143 /DNA_ID=CAMNT_0027855669 /DNA_START=85 /DNA_END=516 /DNA_ORIENTATION=+